MFHRNSVPDRWEEYTAIGNQIEGTRFFCFKVPLREQISDKLDEDKRFTPSMFLEQVKEKGYKIGALLDLTNTNRYYSNHEFTKQGIEYHKISTEGHQIPNARAQKRFCKTLEECLSRLEGDTDLIGIHCTHGVNRTGYMVCRYMINEMEFEPEKAIEVFNKARGHDIERENYLEDLKKGKKNLDEMIQAEKDERNKRFAEEGYAPGFYYPWGFPPGPREFNYDVGEFYKDDEFENCHKTYYGFNEERDHRPWRQYVRPRPYQYRRRPWNNRRGHGHWRSKGQGHYNQNENGHENNENKSDNVESNDNQGNQQEGDIKNKSG